MIDEAGQAFPMTALHYLRLAMPNFIFLRSSNSAWIPASLDNPAAFAKMGAASPSRLKVCVMGAGLGPRLKTFFISIDNGNEHFSCDGRTINIF